MLAPRRSSRGCSNRATSSSYTLACSCATCAQERARARRRAASAISCSQLEIAVEFEQCCHQVLRIIVLYQDGLLSGQVEEHQRVRDRWSLPVAHRRCPPAPRCWLLPRSLAGRAHRPAGTSSVRRHRQCLTAQTHSRDFVTGDCAGHDLELKVGHGAQPVRNLEDGAIVPQPRAHAQTPETPGGLRLIRWAEKDWCRRRAVSWIPCLREGIAQSRTPVR